MKEEKKKYPRGIRNNNPFNIKKGNNWQGEKHPQTDPIFEEFESMVMGIRAALKLMRNHITGFGGKRRKANTVALLIRVWAPATENNTTAYIKTVCQQTGYSQNDIIHFTDRRQIMAIARAMCFVECGEWLAPALFETAYDLL